MSQHAYNSVIKYVFGQGRILDLFDFIENCGFSYHCAITEAFHLFYNGIKKGRISLILMKEF